MNVLRSLAAASVWALGCGSAVFMHTAPVASAAPVPTTTTLAVTSGGNAVTSAGSGTAITLTATVMASGAAVKVGQVVFCDMAASHCSSIDSIGEAQLTSAGTATIRLVPGIGNHSLEAAFLGTTNDLSSSSAASALSVTGDHSTTTSISESGSAGSYSLTATVVGYADKTSPTGTVSFLDASNGNALLASATAGSGTAGLAWLNASNPATEGYPQSIATGDFNNDGIPDLAVANSGSGTVNILLGNGDGTFRQANNSPVTVGEYPWSIAVGDFNGDGNTDLAVANYGSSSVSILLGNGDGTFAPGPDSPISLPGAPGTIVTSDFNDDGIADLAVLAPAPNGTVTILLGFGNGAFAQAPGNPLSIAYAYSLAATDFNSDGIPDLIVLSTIGTATIQLGNGNGTFTQSGSAFSIGNSPDAVAVGDFNGDGISDLAIIDWGGNAVRILLGKGNAKFSEGPPIAVGNEPSSIAIGDFNGDGFEDLAISNEEDQTVTILLGSGNGTFTQASASPVKQAGTPVSIVAADLNGDGFWDFAVADQDNSVAVAELSQLTETVTATSSGISVSGSPSSHSVVANYSGDGNYASSTSFATALRAQPLTPTVAVTPSAATISTIDPLTVTIDVSGGNGNPVPAGSVQLSGGGYTSAAAALSSGIATINVPAGVLATGADTFTAAYAPDAASSPTYSSSSGTTSIWVGGPSAATPVVTVSPLPANIAANQSMTVNISVAGGSGNPVPTGLVTVMSNNPAAQIYDTFQYPDGTLINGKTAQSGNSVWSIGSDGIGVVEDMHLANAAPNVEGGVMYATLANTITVGGAPQPVTTIGGTIRLCPSDSGTYTSYPSVGMIATHDPSFKSFIEIGFGPSSWWADKNVNGAGTHTIASGSENLLVDCTTEYTVQMIINQAAGTYQIIPPDGIPSAVNNDPDITTIDALYGVWEPENNAPEKYIGEWGSVWMGGGYISAASTLSNGTGTINIPAGSLALGTDTLTANYTPDLNSAPIYNDASGTNSVAVKASQSITFPAMLPQPVNSTFTLPATASSGLPVTYSTSTPNRCTISGNTVNLLATGYCGIYASQPGNSNFFAAATVGRNIDIVKEAQTIAFPSTPPQLANSTFTLAATSSSGLPITYTSTTPSICTISGSTANPLAAGDCGIHASQPGNSLYAAASTVSRNIQIVKASQIITFTPMPAQPANTTFTLAATASSGLPVTYATSTPSICTISGGTANLLATGYCGIYASQPGNSIYAAATTVGRNLQVLPAY